MAYTRKLLLLSLRIINKALATVPSRRIRSKDQWSSVHWLIPQMAPRYCPKY